MPCAGLEKFRILKLFKSSTRFVQVPEGSFTFKSKSLTRLVAAAVVEAGSLYANAICRSPAAAGTEKLQPLFTPVVNDSLWANEVLIAANRLILPLPS